MLESWNPSADFDQIFLRSCFFCCYFSRHISNLNFRKDTFLNSNSYFSFTSPNYHHSRQNPFIWIPVTCKSWSTSRCFKLTHHGSFLVNKNKLSGLDWEEAKKFNQYNNCGERGLNWVQRIASLVCIIECCIGSHVMFVDGWARESERRERERAMFFFVVFTHL